MESFRKKNHARENYRNGIYKGTHTWFSVEFKHNDMAISRTKTLKAFNLSFLEQSKSLIQENQPEINKQPNSVPSIHKPQFIQFIKTSVGTVLKLVNGVCRTRTEKEQPRGY